MKWFLDLFSSSLGRKLMMALTGLFLISFITIHLIGNLQLLKGDGGKSFNVYAEFMTSNPVIKTISYVNYTLILVHVFWALLLTRKNSEARGLEGYAIRNKSTGWSSRNMGILGTLILIFIIIHLRQFWYEMHWGGIPHADYDGKDVKDLYIIVAFAYQNIWYVALYVFSMGVLAFHLWHGFASAFQTLGINHKKYNPLIGFVGKVYSIVVPALFAVIPIVMFFESKNQ
jgi:succinate dehydrogenase / fumarate reductase cytochrome b subunit